jgi:hypothetical protein
MAWVRDMQASMRRLLMTMTITCDRCDQQISGYETEAVTSGFYRTGSPPWSKYADEDEEIICDSCMWSDERYLADYPHMRGKTGDDALTLGRDIPGGTDAQSP